MFGEDGEDIKRPRRRSLDGEIETPNCGEN